MFSVCFTMVLRNPTLAAVLNAGDFVILKPQKIFLLEEGGFFPYRDDVVRSLSSFLFFSFVLFHNVWSDKM